MSDRELRTTKTLLSSWFAELDSITNDKELVRKEKRKEVVKIMKQKRTEANNVLS